MSGISLAFFLSFAVAYATPAVEIGDAEFRSLAVHHCMQGLIGIDELPDEYDAAVRETVDLYSHIVSLLKSVESPKGYRAIEDSLGSTWRDITTLRSRYPDLDPEILNDRLSKDDRYRRLEAAFNTERERIRREVPDVAHSMDDMLGAEPSTSFGEKAVEEIMTLYEEIVHTLEGIETPQDGENSFDFLRDLAVRLKGVEETYDDIKDRVQELIEDDPRSIDLSNRLDAVFMRLGSDSGMESVFEALEPLATEDPHLNHPTPEEEIILEEYGLLIEKAIDLLRQVKTPDDIERLAPELLELQRMDEEFNRLLPGKRGEVLIESNPRLARLMQELGTEEMRIEEDPDLRAGMAVLFGEVEEGE